MTKINFEENFEIYLFTYPNEEAQGTSKLNEFLSFLKFHKVALPYKFSFVAREASLIPEMTLNQNILIDFTPDSLTESKEVQFQDFLGTQGNRALEALYKSIELPHELPDQTNAQMKKACSLMKSLLYEGQFIFLEEPEVGLDSETLNLFINALKEHVKAHQINVFIFSRNLSLWMPHAQKMVQRMKNYSFLISPVSRNFLWDEERERFYAPPELEQSFDSLKLTIPSRTRKKKAA